VTIRVFERDGQEGGIVYTFSQPVIGGRPDGKQIFS